MKTFNSIYIDEFLMEKVVNQWISDKMLTIYHTVFRLLITDERICPSDLSTYTTRNFKTFLWENFLAKGWSSATYNSYRRYLKCFCAYLVKEELLDANPFDRISKRKEPQQLPKALTSAQVSELLNALTDIFDKQTFTGLRNITMVYSFLHTGLRLSELTSLKCSDLKLEEGYLKVVKGKWMKDRIVPLDNALMKLLHHYRKQARGRLQDDSYLFPTNYGKSLRGRDMRSVIDKIRKGISFHFTWHQLRHTFATELVRNNFDIYNISRILGHSKIDTTKIYLSVDVGRLKKQLDGLQLFS